MTNTNTLNHSNNGNGVLIFKKENNVTAPTVKIKYLAPNRFIVQLQGKSTKLFDDYELIGFPIYKNNSLIDIFFSIKDIVSIINSPGYTLSLMTKFRRYQPDLADSKLNKTKIIESLEILYPNPRTVEDDGVAYDKKSISLDIVEALYLKIDSLIKKQETLEQEETMTEEIESLENLPTPHHTYDKNINISTLDGMFHINLTDKAISLDNTSQIIYDIDLKMSIPQDKLDLYINTLIDKLNGLKGLINL